MYQINHYILAQIVIIRQISLTLLVIDCYLLQKKYQTAPYTLSLLYKNYLRRFMVHDKYNIIQRQCFFCRTTHCICHDTLAKVVVTFYQRLRNELEQFPAKNQSQASNWLTCWVGHSEAKFLA